MHYGTNAEEQQCFQNATCENKLTVEEKQRFCQKIHTFSSVTQLMLILHIIFMLLPSFATCKISRLYWPRAFLLKTRQPLNVTCRLFPSALLRHQRATEFQPTNDLQFFFILWQKRFLKSFCISFSCTTNISSATRHNDESKRCSIWKFTFLSKIWYLMQDEFKWIWFKSKKLFFAQF